MTVPSGPHRLLVVMSDPLTPILTKGEVIPRYYNPGDVFDEVHFLLLNDDRPDLSLLAPLAGRAKVATHNHPLWPQFLLRSLILTPAMVRRWARGGVEIARRIGPAAVRSLNPWLDGFLCAQIRRQLRVPYLLSLHGNPDIDYFRGRLARSWKHKVWGMALDPIETVAVGEADVVMPVYSPILPYFERKTARRIELVYNTVGLGLKPKVSYGLDPAHVRLICVGRQEPEQKDPTPIIEAVAALPGVHLTLVGRGELHEKLKALTVRLGVTDRIKLEQARPNHQLMATLAEHDLFIYASINHEISKGCMEAALCGLPVIANDRGGEPARELVDCGFRLVPGTAEGYRQALAALIADERARRDLGQQLRREAERRWSPQTTEQRQAALYRELIATRISETAPHG